MGRTIVQSKAATVKEYLDELPEDRREALSRVRKLIRKTAPAATEGMQYGMIGYSLGPLLFSLGSQKNYMALYVCDPAAVEAHRERLGKLNCGKGCIRFRELEDLPLDAIGDILAEALKRRVAVQDSAAG
jgi:uncharacterized protein YdhG (YjbR/CyaY superfamily)